MLVQEALGHSSLDTSRIYTHFDSSKLRIAAQVAEDLDKNAWNFKILKIKIFALIKGFWVLL